VPVKDLPARATYCGTDCRRTWALQRVLERQLADLGLLQVYAEHHRAVNVAALELSLTGLPVDETTRRQHADRLDAALAQLREDMKKETGGIDLVATVDISSKRAGDYLYGPPPSKLGCAVARRTNTGAPSVDEIAVRQLMLTDPPAVAIGTLLLASKHALKMRGFVDAARVDADGRLRSLYRPVTKTGRCACASTPLGTGANAQNYPAELRDIFVAAHPGCLFVQFDLSQAESRIVDGSSSDPHALVLARTSPVELDQHAQLAAEVLGKPVAEITKEERHVVAKKGRHGVDYGLGAVTLSEQLLKSQINRTPEECQEILDGVLAARPYIRRWQEWVWATGERGVLVNSWGCRYVTERFQPTRAQRREWLAWGPQGEVARLLTQKGWLVARGIIRRGGLQTEIVHQGHDSLVLHGPVEELFDLCTAVAQSLAAPREYRGVDGLWELAMPVGWGVGRNLSALHEWKVAPSRDESLEIARTYTGSTVAEPALLQAAG